MQQTFESPLALLKISGPDQSVVGGLGSQRVFAICIDVQYNSVAS